jgi:hypothetical protein
MTELPVITEGATRRYQDINPRTGKVRGTLNLTDAKALDLITGGNFRLRLCTKETS